MLVLVLGTGTEVGKTWVACRLARHLGAVARKPAQSFSPGEATDADLLAAATGEAPEMVCPPHRWYPVPMAPPMAADALALPPFTIADLASELSWPNDERARLVEGAGGVRSPLAHDGDAIDLARAISPDIVVLVADAGLGTINAVRLSVAALNGWPVVVYLNRYDDGNDLHRRNRAWLEERDGFRIAVSVPAVVA
jgi:dethiobiotin synthetase